MEQDKDDKDGKQKDKKASFRKRLCAYFIDILIIIVNIFTAQIKGLKAAQIQTRHYWIVPKTQKSPVRTSATRVSLILLYQ